MPANKLLKADQLNALRASGADQTLADNTSSAPDTSFRKTSGSGPQGGAGDFGSTCKFSTSNAG